MRPEQSKPSVVVPPSRYAVPIVAAAAATTESPRDAPVGRRPTVARRTGSGEGAPVAGDRPGVPGSGDPPDRLAPPNTAPSRSDSSGPSRPPGLSLRHRPSTPIDKNESGIS